jgi:hypothetical protein
MFEPRIPIDRRRFLTVSTIATSAMVGLQSQAWAWGDLKNRAGDRFRQWFAAFSAPRQLWIVPPAADLQEGMIVESAAGLAALSLRLGKGDVLIYEEIPNEGYQRWVDEYCRAISPTITRLSLDEAVARLLKAQLVRGYLLFRYEQSDRPLHSAGKVDESANVATSLAPAHHALIVPEQLVQRVEKLGLKQLLDLRDRTEEWCLSQHDFSRTVLGTADPKTRNVRSLMIALNAFCCSGRGKTYDQALARCSEDCPVIGWGCEDENKQTSPSSRWGLFQTATNWCFNLPVFATETIGKSIPAESLRDRHSLDWKALDWGDDVHHVNFTLSDGDNVQWVMGNFVSGGEAPSYYGNPKRGSIPFTWGLPVPSLCQLSPRTLAEILAKATPNDDFMQFSGGGYFYPDEYGKARGTTRAMELHAERLRTFMELTGIRILAFNFLNWDNAEATAACQILASKLPGLLGIFAFQYYPYSAGNGAIHWVRGLDGDEVPIVSCRLTMWAQTGRPRDTTPAGVAAHLNQLPRAGEKTSSDAFSWVMVHAWSRFRRSPKDCSIDAEEKDVAQDKVAADVARGYEPALWAAERLGGRVKAVSARELLMRIRLRLRPQSTLRRWLAEVETKGSGKGGEPSPKISEIRALLDRTPHDPIAMRRCFELLKHA